MIQYNQAESPMSPHSFLGVVRKRRKLIGTLFLVIFLAIVIIAFVWPRTFKAESAVMVNYQLNNDEAHLLDLYKGSEHGYYNRISSETLIFKMRSILGPVADGIWGEKKDAQDDPVIVSESEKEQRIEQLKDGLEIERELDTNVLMVRFANHNPQLAKRIVDRVVTEYVQQRPQLSRDERAYEFFDQQIQRYRRQLKEIKERGMAYQKENRLISGDKQSSILFQSMSEFDHELTKVRAERIAKEARAQVMREQISEGKELAIPSTLGAADSRSRYDYINKLKTALMEYEVQKEQFQQKYTQNHPKMKELLIAIQKSRAKLQEEIREILEEEEANIKALRSAEAAIVQRMNTVAASISDISEKQYELGQMTIGVNDLEAVLSMLVRQREEAHIAAQERAHLVQVRLLQPASVPRDLVWPNRPLLIGLGLVLAFIVAFGSAFFVEYFDHSVNTVEDAQHCLGLPILAVIPEAARVSKASEMPPNKKRRPY